MGHARPVAGGRGGRLLRPRVRVVEADKVVIDGSREELSIVVDNNAVVTVVRRVVSGA